MKIKKKLTVGKFIKGKIESRKVLKKDRAIVEIKEVKPLPEKSSYFKNQFERE